MIYVVALAAACVLNVVNMLSTLAALKGKHIFNPAGKWSPLSFMKLTHEASQFFVVDHCHKYWYRVIRMLQAIGGQC